MAVNKVTINGSDVLDLTSDTATASDVASGKTFHLANGLQALGTAPTPDDYVVEYGTSGIWTYRKWNSGVAECWGSISKTVTSWSAWGGIYESGQNFQASYPSGLFTATPELFAAPYGQLGLAGVEYYQGASSTQTPQMYLLRGNTISGSYSCAVNCFAIGRWQ